MNNKKKYNITFIRIFFVMAIIVFSIAFFGCGSSGGGESDWYDENNVVRVSNLKGRVIAPLNNPASARTSAQAYFSLLSTEGTKVFIEDNSSLNAICDADGYFIIPNVPEGKHRIIANVVAGTTTYRQRSDVITVTGQYETQEIPYSIELSPALYSAKLYLSDLKTSSPVVGKVNVWGFTYDSINGVVDIGPFPEGLISSKEARVTAIGYKDLNTLINFGEDYKSEIYIKMTPTTSTDSNQAPVIAIQQTDTIVKTNEEITLSGLGLDPEGDVITWKWSADKGSFYNPNGQRTTFLAPEASGTVRITLSGSDSKGATGLATLDIHVQQGGSSGFNPNNKPPVAPNTPYPADLSTGMGGDLILSWECSDPNNDAITYTVNFGKQGSNLITIATGLTDSKIGVKNLEANTRYYWQVTAYDTNYASSNSEMWQFSTGDLNNQPPNVPTYPTPADKATDIPEDYIAFSWSGGDPDGDTVQYKFYLATASTSVPSETTGLTLIQTNNLLKFDYYGLAKGATYQWQIVAVDSRGAETEGPIWTFFTVEPENNMPSSASITEPANSSTKVAVNQKLRWTATDEDGDTLYYDVYFGTASEPPLVSASQPSQIFDPGTLENDTTYYWRIVVSDGKVANPESELWSFTTEEIPDPAPFVVAVTTPASITSSLRIEFSEYIDNSKESEAFSFSPEVSGTWKWSNGNTIAEFTPDGGWLPGSYNKFVLVGNLLTDATGKLLESSLEKKFDVPAEIEVPAGYHSYAFPIKLVANQTISITIPDLKYGKSAYVVAIADGNAVNPNVRVSQSMNDYLEKDPTYALRMEEARMIHNPIVVPQKNSALRSVVSSAEIGDERKFYINAVATDTSYPNNKITATLTKMSGNTIVYVDNSITDANKETFAQKVLTTFDNNIIQQVRNAFGNEPEFGVDGESRITIVLIKIGEGNSTAGYYYSGDLYSNSYYKDSNEGKIFYIKYGMEDSTTFGTLAHEFQHMINYYQKNKTLAYNAQTIDEEAWLNEALSKYSEEICGYSILDGDYNTTSLIRYSMLNNNKLSLTYWGPNTLHCYGQVYLFMHFLAYPGRYNSNSAVITRSLVTGNGSAITGEANVEAVTGEPFKLTLAKYALSLCLNNYTSTSPTAYSINNINLKGKYNTLTLPGYSIENISNPVSLSDMPYKNSIRFFKKTAGGAGNVSFSITAGTQPCTLWLFDERE